MRERDLITAISAAVPWCFMAIFAPELWAAGLLQISMIFAVVASVVAGAIGFIVGGYAEEE